MIFPLKLALSLTLLALPLVEIALLIKVGGLLGFWPVVAIIVATGFAGVAVIRAAGLSAMTRLFAQLEDGGSPLKSLLDQILRLTGGVLLLLPGFIGDGIGALLMIPATRHLIIASSAGLFKFQGAASVRMEETHFETRRPGDAGGGAEWGGRVTIIEGDYERIDEDSPRRGAGLRD